MILLDNGRKSGTGRNFGTADTRTRSEYSSGRSGSARRVSDTRRQSDRYQSDTRRTAESRVQSSGMNRQVTRSRALSSSVSSRSVQSGTQDSAPRRRPMTEAERRKKMEQVRKRERLRKQRIRAAVTFFLIVAVVVVLLFMTPIFAVKRIVLNGNNLVTKEQIEVQIKDFVGDNLFRLRAANVEKKMLEIPLISGVAVEKKIFPPSIILNISETRPAAYLLSGNSIVVVDSNLKVLDDANNFDTNTIPSISGIGVPGYTVNSIIQTDSQEKADILREMLSIFESTGLTSSIKYISVDDLTNIRFNYENRIEALCGSQLELERKIRMFAEAIKTETISPDALGTMDLSILGQATYQSNLSVINQ